MRFALAALVLSLGIPVTLAGCSQGGPERLACACADGTEQPSAFKVGVPAAFTAEGCALACAGHRGVELPDAGEGD